VLGNLVVALFLSSLQLVALLGAAVLRGASSTCGPPAWPGSWPRRWASRVLMYGIAETLANRIPTQEEYVGALPAIAIVPWFFGGSLFPIAAMPMGLTAFAKVLPITHVLALLRYGVADTHGIALHDIWGMDNTTTMAALSLGVVVASRRCSPRCRSGSSPARPQLKRPERRPPVPPPGHRFAQKSCRTGGGTGEVHIWLVSRR